MTDTLERPLTLARPTAATGTSHDAAVAALRGCHRATPEHVARLRHLFQTLSDEFESDAEYLDNVECPECHASRWDLVAAPAAYRCDECGVVECCTVALDCPNSDLAVNQACQDCAPLHACGRGCPECEPPERD